MASYTGLRARIYGIVWGSLFVAVGIGASLFFVIRFGLLPPALGRAVVNLTPLTDSVVGPTPRRTVPLALFGVLSLGTAVMGCYGLYEIGQALFKDEYSVEFTVEGGADGGM